MAGLVNLPRRSAKPSKKNKVWINFDISFQASRKFGSTIGSECILSKLVLIFWARQSAY